MKGKDQIDFWKGSFGQEYTIRNSRSQEEWDRFHLDTWGITKIDMYREFIGDLDREIRILEVGSNTGMQLSGLQRLGFVNLYGIELQPNAAELSKTYTKNINIITGSGFDIPFKDGFFDLVFTSGVLIHIAPENLRTIMGEMVRCSQKYILGFEYFSREITPIVYRGNNNCLWKADYPRLFREYFPELRESKRKMYKYLKDDNQDIFYLLEK